MRDEKTQAAITELRNYNSLKTTVENLQDERIRTDAAMKSTGGSLSPVPIHGGGCRQEEKMINGIAKKDMIEIQLKEKEATVRIIERTLSALTQREKRVLEVSYIYDSDNPVDRLCEELNVEEITVHRIKRRALQKYVEMRGA